MRTPGWSAWSTVLIGFIVSLAVGMPAAVREMIFNSTGLRLSPLLTPEMFAWIPGFGGPFKPEELTEFTVIATVGSMLVVCVSWFFFTTLFYDRAPVAYRATVDEFFARLKTPLPDNPAEAVRENHGFVGAVGYLCFVYGGFIMLLVMIPNSFRGRLCYMACGGVILLIGAMLVRSHRRQARVARDGKAEGLNS
jgi:hypothetical protein